MVSGSGALVVRTGKRTGRSPKDRFIIENDVTRDAVDWGTGNKAFSSDAFGALLDKAAAYIENLEEIYVVDAYAGADPRYSLNVHVVTEHAWQALFARQLFRRPSREELDAFEPDWTVISVPGLLTDPEEDGTESETFVGIDFERKVVLDLRHGLRRRDQKEHLHGPELRLADRTRRLPDALLGQHGQEGRRGALLRALGHGQDDIVSRPGAVPDRGRRARLVRHRGLQLRGRLLRQDDRPLRREGTPDLGRHPLRGCAGERGDGPPHARGGLLRPHADGEHPRRLPAGVHSGRRPGRHGRPPIGRPVLDRRRLRGLAPHKRPHALAGRLLLPLRLHRQARRYRGRHGDRGRGDVLHLLRRPVPSPAGDHLRRDALREAEARTAPAATS